VRNALSLMLTAKGEPVAVLDGDGGVEGLVTLEAIEQLLADEAGAPAAGGSAVAVEPSHGAGS
jgi:CBS domain containing-hemolysin-like protein